MQCSSHNNVNATGVCAYCGRGLCSECARLSSTGQLACSENCETKLVAAARSLNATGANTLRLKVVTSYAYFLLGAISVAFALFALTLEGYWLLALWAGPLGIAMILAGFWYKRGVASQGSP